VSNPKFPKTVGDWAVKLMIKYAINNKRKLLNDDLFDKFKVLTYGF
jgi:hypothetical protein